MTFSLQGKTALVTGSTSGIGLGIAIELARQGASLVLNGFGDAEAAKAQIAALGARVEHHPADMSRPADIAAMMQVRLPFYEDAASLKIATDDLSPAEITNALIRLLQPFLSGDESR